MQVLSLVLIFIVFRVWYVFKGLIFTHVGLVTCGLLCRDTKFTYGTVFFLRN